VKFTDPASAQFTSYVVQLLAPSMPGLQWNFPNVPATGPLVAQMDLSTLSPPFDPSQGYTVVVTGSPGGNPSSPYKMAWSQPAVTSIVVTSAAIAIAFSDIYPPPGVSNYSETLWSAPSVGVNFPDVAAGLPMTTSMPQPPGGLDPSVAYTVSVTSFTSAGPAATSAALAVVSATVTCVTQLAVDLQTLTVTALVPPTTPAWTAFTFQLLQGDVVIATKAGVPPTSDQPWTLAKPLSPGRQYAVAVLGQIASPPGSAMSLGAAGPPTPVIADSPAILGTPTYDGTFLSVTWFPVSNPAVTGYAVIVSPTGADNQVFLAGPVTTLSTRATLTGAAQVRVAAIGPASVGPPGAAAAVVAPAITGTPAVASARYDGGTLTLVWSAVLDAAVLGYHVVVGPGGAVDRVVAGTSLSLPIDLDPATAYTVTVAAVSAVGAGPTSAALAVVAAAPELTSVTYAAGTVTAAWTLAAPPAGATYELALFDGGGVVARTTTGTGPTGGTLAATLAPGRAYTVAARALAAAGAAVGPWSGAGAIITGAPAVTSTRYDGQAVTVAWGALADDTVSAYLVTLAEVGGGAVGSPVVAAGTSAVVPATGVTPGKSYQITVQAIGGGAVGPAGAPAAAVIETVSITSASYDGRFVTAAWAAATAPNATYVVELWSAGQLVVAQASAQTKVTFAAALAAAAAVTATVRVLVGGGVGQPGPTQALVTATTYVTQGSTDAMSGMTTFSWAALTNATSYLLQPYLGGLPLVNPIPVTGTTYTYPVALYRDSDFTVNVAGVVTTNGVPVTGPFGPIYHPPTIQPVIGTASYDGVNASISWGFVSGSTGYRVSVLQGGQQQPIGTIDVTPTTNQVVFAPSITDPNRTYGAIVQSMIGTDTGPPSAQAPLFSPGFFVSTSPAATYAPFVYPATTLAQVSSPTLGQSGTTAVIYLPSLGAANISVPQQGPFALAQNTDPNTNAAFPYTLTIPGNSAAWVFSPAAVRAGVQNDYVTFLKNLEGAGALPGGIAAVQQAISRYMPQTFQETLYYAYGLDLVNGSVDLRPGMVLRVALDDYVAVGDQSISTWLDGYVGGTVVDYDIGSYVAGGKWLAGPDALIAQLVASGALKVTAPPSSGSNMAGVADAADLFYTDFVTPFYRLFFPPTLETPTGPGSVVPADNFALAAAASYLALTQSSRAGTPVAYFRGRAVARACIRVALNGVEAVVPVGTTVGNLLDSWACRPPGAPVGLDDLTVARSLGPVVLNPGVPFDVGQAYPVRLDWKTLAQYAPFQDALSLPLLHGDRISVGG
jgi:hypothetical protein